MPSRSARDSARSRHLRAAPRSFLPPAFLRRAAAARDARSPGEVGGESGGARGTGPGGAASRGLPSRGGGGGAAERDGARDSRAQRGRGSAPRPAPPAPPPPYPALTGKAGKRLGEPPDSGRPSAAKGPPPRSTARAGRGDSSPVPGAGRPGTPFTAAACKWPLGAAPGSAVRAPPRSCERPGPRGASRRAAA